MTTYPVGPMEQAGINILGVRWNSDDEPVYTVQCHHCGRESVMRHNSIYGRAFEGLKRCRLCVNEDKIVWHLQIGHLPAASLEILEELERDARGRPTYRVKLDCCGTVRTLQRKSILARINAGTSVCQDCQRRAIAVTGGRVRAAVKAIKDHVTKLTTTRPPQSDNATRRRPLFRHIDRVTPEDLPCEEAMHPAYAWPRPSCLAYQAPLLEHEIVSRRRVVRDRRDIWG